MNKRILKNVAYALAGVAIVSRIPAASRVIFNR